MNTIKIPFKVTIAEKYGPAMEITEQDKAAEYFEACVKHNMEHGSTREKGEQIERSNLAYYAGYYDDKVRERVERLFSCSHPVFGSIKNNGAPSTESALLSGVLAGLKTRDKMK